MNTFRVRAKSFTVHGAKFGTKPKCYSNAQFCNHSYYNRFINQELTISPLRNISFQPCQRLIAVTYCNAPLLNVIITFNLYPKVLNLICRSVILKTEAFVFNATICCCALILTNKPCIKRQYYVHYLRTFP